MSANQVQQIAKCAHDDEVRLLRSLKMNEDLANPVLRHLGKLGAEGKHPGNVLTQLKHYLGDPLSPPCMMHPIPMKLPKSNKTECQIPFWLPHATFAWYWNDDQDRFRQLFLGGRDSAHKIEEFWQTLLDRGDPRLDGHPMRKQASWMQRAVPFAIHGDGVPVLSVGKAGAKSYEVWSCKSLFGSGSTVSVKLMMFGFWPHAAIDDTWQEVWRLLTWSLY